MKSHQHMPASRPYLGADQQIEWNAANASLPEGPYSASDIEPHHEYALTPNRIEAVRTIMRLAADFPERWWRLLDILPAFEGPKELKTGWFQPKKVVCPRCESNVTYWSDHRRFESKIETRPLELTAEEWNCTACEWRGGRIRYWHYTIGGA